VGFEEMQERFGLAPARSQVHIGKFIQFGSGESRRSFCAGSARWRKDKWWYVRGFNPFVTDESGD
jgi:hypothetical protein